jgi:hypothetical protein
MELLRERFLKTYANTPLGLRGDIILLLENTSDTKEPKKPITWDVAYIEVKGNGGKSEEILNGLAELNLI